MQARP
ncbi:hypothetical protein D039_0474A, partial [Vibrio parahaemolyticus EKP-028]